MGASVGSWATVISQITTRIIKVNLEIPANSHGSIIKYVSFGAERLNNMPTLSYPAFFLPSCHLSSSRFLLPLLPHLHHPPFSLPAHSLFPHDEKRESGKNGTCSGKRYELCNQSLWSRVAAEEKIITGKMSTPG